jgi:hypothetical protein
MLVNTQDGYCRQCRGALEIIDADDATMTVRCTDCQDEYQVETDAFQDGGVIYWPLFMSDRLWGGRT